MRTMLTFVQGSREHRMYQAVGWGLFALLAVVLPYWLPAFQVGRLNRAILLAIAILGVNLVIGYSGLIALSHGAFIGIGAFLAATLVVDEGWDYWMVLPVAFIVTFLVGMVLGLPALRIRGLYLALVTIAFAAVFPTLAKIDGLAVGGKTIADRTGGPNGRIVREEVVAPDWLPDFIFGNELDGHLYRYWIILGIALLCFWAIRNILRSRPGRAIVAIRDNEIGAVVSGVNLPLYKTLTFGLSSALAGVAGVLLTMDKGFAGEQDFGFALAIDLLVGVVVGGLGTLWGGPVGGLVVVFVREMTKGWPDQYLGFLDLPNPAPLSLAFFGLILVLVTFFAPGGIVGLLRKVKARLVSVIPRAPDGTPINELAAARAEAAEAEAAAGEETVRS